MFECVISSFVDEFPRLRSHKLLFTSIMSLILFLLGIPCVMQGGMYVLQLMDWYSASFSLMIISFFEAFVIGWVYGADRFLQDIKLMCDRLPPCWWKLCWKYLTPAVIAALLVFIIINHTPVTYNEYNYPDWAIWIGWVMALCSLVPIPVIAILKLCKAKGTFQQRMVQCLRPSPEWGPATEEFRILYHKSLTTLPANFKQLHVAGVSEESVIGNSRTVEDGADKVSGASTPLNSSEEGTNVTYVSAC